LGLARFLCQNWFFWLLLSTRICWIQKSQVPFLPSIFSRHLGFQNGRHFVIFILEVS